MSNPTGKGGFGDHKEHINRKGRPASFDGLRELALQIAHEVATRDGKPLVYDGHRVTATELILRQWAASKDPRLQQAFIQIAYGKVPDEVKISGAVRHDIEYPSPEEIAEARRVLSDALGRGD